MATISSTTVMLLGVMLALCVGATQAGMGVDVSTAVSRDAFKCMHDSGVHFAVVRAYQSNGVVDPNAANTIKAAHAGGLDFVDAYLFPCFHCGNAAKQVNDTIDNLHHHGASFHHLWLDVEAENLWGSHSDNVRFIDHLVDAARARGVNVGIYSSQYEWESVTGNSEAFRSLPLWFALYNGVKSLDFTTPFGGWHNPVMKQYSGTSSLCGAGVDMDWN